MHLDRGGIIGCVFCLLVGTVISLVDNLKDELRANRENTNVSYIISSTPSPEAIKSSNLWVYIPQTWTQPDTSQVSAVAKSHIFTTEDRKGRGADPFFEHSMTTNISEQLDTHVFLRCRVKNLRDRSVSWIRRRDWHILTSGRTVYTNDDRFKLRHVEGSEDWMLVIEFVQIADDGTYECQVPTSRGTISHFFNLQVLIPKAFILGAKEYHVQDGTVISLVCIVENGIPGVSQYFYWYHNNVMVNYGTRVTVYTEPSTQAHSRLTVASARSQDSGNYTCKTSNTEPASVTIFVSEGDKTAAMQGQGSSLYVQGSMTISVLTILTILVQHTVFS